MATAEAASSERSSSQTLEIELLFLDLTTCTRCRGADESLVSALESVREVLTAAGTEVEVKKIHVTSAEHAHELHFESSPTIRVNGRDIALELRESSCGSEACADGCGDHIDCRVWVHEGHEYTEPPAAMIVDAILREVYAAASVEREIEARTYELPENLARFFAGTEIAEPAQPAPEPAKACCSPSEQDSCCEPGDKAECCGASAGGGCGCR
jgi:hypothetical protein